MIANQNVVGSDMVKNLKKNIWIYIALILAVVLVVANYWPSPSLEAAQMEPSAQANADPDRAIPAPSKPLFKKEDPSKVTTIIAEAPQANGVNGAPKTLQTELGLTVSPLCFDQLFGPEGMKESIDVTTCDAVSGYKNIKTELANGNYQTTYEFPSEPDMPTETGIVSYEVIGQTTAGTAVQTYSETGGTGRFSSIVMVDLKGNLLKVVNSVAGGDRCNGGLVDASIKDGKLSYTVNATPGDFPILAWGSDKGIKPYEDLEASAMSCFAEVTYTDGVLSRVLLNADVVKETSDWSAQYKYQNCFNKKIREAINIGYADMTFDLFRNFMNGFEKECISATQQK